MQNMPTKYGLSVKSANLHLTPNIQVVQKIGLCICVYDILSASDGLIGHGTGIVNVNGKPPR